MSRERIQNLEELLRPHIGDKKVVDSKITRLTAPGENYGGLLLKVDVILENGEGVREELPVVAKSIPINDFLKKIFNIQVTVKNEIALYDTIVPELQAFQREHGVPQVIDFFPELYGARINLNGSDVVDENAAIIMENLVESGYKNVDRFVGFDLQTAELIVKTQAAFHAVALALRLTKPDVFEKKIKPYLSHLRPPSPPPPSENTEPPLTPNNVLMEFFNTCEEIKELLPILEQIVTRNQMQQERDIDPFSTVAHSDLWINNIMVKFEDGRPVSSKFVDFQNLSLRSSVEDLLFFLWSSVQLPVLEINFDALLKLYHETFIENLRQLNCDLGPYSFKNFLEKLGAVSTFVLSQALFMITFVVFGKKGGFVDEDSSKPPDLGSVEDITPEARERVIYITKDCNKRGWLSYN